MFPRYNQIHKDKIPHFYFDGQEPPTYHQIPLPANAQIEDIVQIIYNSAYTKHMCGYITDTAIFYFIDERGKIQIDASKEFIFLAERGVEPFTHPAPEGIVSFIQDPCDKAIFISEEAAYYIEKTPETYQLCAELDAIWDEDEFYENVLEKVNNGERQSTELLSALMKEYEKRKFGIASYMWDAVEENKDHILEEKLFLHITKFVVQSE